MAIRKELWSNYIAKQIFPDGTWVTKSVDESIYVEGAKVHRGEQQGLPAVKINPTELRLDAVRIEDTPLEYEIASHVMPPLVVKSLDATEATYPLFETKTTQMADSINYSVEMRTLYDWSPRAERGTFVPTSGATRASFLGAIAGSVKKLTMADISSACLLMDEQRVPSSNRNILLASYMLQDLFDEVKSVLGVTNIVTVMQYLKEYYNLNVIKRSSFDIARYKALPNSKFDRELFSAALAADTVAGAILWHEKFVGRAKGGVELFPQYDHPEYQGDVISGSMRAGGEPMYSDMKGVIAIVESKTA